MWIGSETMLRTRAGDDAGKAFTMSPYAVATAIGYAVGPGSPHAALTRSGNFGDSGS